MPTACNTDEVVCFVSNCDPTSDEHCDLTPYKKIRFSYANTPECVIQQTCPEINCQEIDGCKLVSCSENSTEEWERCLE